MKETVGGTCSIHETDTTNASKILVGKPKKIVLKET
jgi:hypothetical protein